MPDIDEESVRARLNEVAARFPQSEIARRTGRPGSTVSRYLKGNRIPVSFVAALGREFGVNPGWLLSGEGAPWVADVRAEETRVGQGLVELVQTMGRLSKLKLGALAGKKHAADLRELNDALEAFERTRDLLASRSRATYAQVLDEWEEAVARRDRTRSTRLHKAAEQVARLCPDPALARRHERLRGSHEYSIGNVPRALTHRRRTFFSSIPDSGEVDEQALSDAFAVVINLDTLGRVAEAVKFAKGALALANRPQRFASYWRCLAAYGWVLIQAGQLQKGMGLTAKALAQPGSAPLRQKCLYSMAYALFLSNSTDIWRAAEMLEPTAGNAQGILFLAPWSDDPAPLEKLLARLARLRLDHESLPGWRIGRAHLLSLQGRHEQALRVWETAEADKTERDRNGMGFDFVMAAMRTQLLRRAGNKGAVKSLHAAQAALDAIPPGVMQDLNWLRVHWRNALALGKHVKGARKFARFCARRGIQFVQA